jgi:hypothetical protein
MRSAEAEMRSGEIVHLIGAADTRMNSTGGFGICVSRPDTRGVTEFKDAM